jgi:hypothetical protein
MAAARDVFKRARIKSVSCFIVFLQQTDTAQFQFLIVTDFLEKLSQQCDRTRLYEAHTQTINVPGRRIWRPYLKWRSSESPR